MDDVGESLPLVLGALAARLRRRADNEYNRALEVSVRRIAGFSPAEIRQQMVLSPDEYRHAHRWLREEARAGDAAG